MTLTLTRKQQRVLEALRRLDDRSTERRAGWPNGLPTPGKELVAEDGWHLAYDIAQEAQVDNRAVGAVLASLRRRELARREHRPQDRVYVWRIA